MDSQDHGKEDVMEQNPFRNRRTKILGCEPGLLIKAFFNGNAVVAIIVLLLITIFLFKEGSGFFFQYRTSLELYRESGVEYADLHLKQVEDFLALNSYITHIRNLEAKAYLNNGLGWSEAEERLKPLDSFQARFQEGIQPLDELAQSLLETSLDTRERVRVYRSRVSLIEDLKKAGKEQEALNIETTPVDLSEETSRLTATRDEYKKILADLEDHLVANQNALPQPESAEAVSAARKFENFISEYIANLQERTSEILDWRYDKQVPIHITATSFLFGKDWITNSFIMDWYGILPLLTGSVLVGCIALLIAVPFGVAAAIYINQIASEREQKLIKPYIEFISAIPSVVIGFFGVAVFGQMIRWLSQQDALSWLPFFPVLERLNAFTAGCLLALMAVPTIFTLAEDALNNVPQAYKEASFAVGATRLQTVIKIILPTALSGIISAILLGFGRVIGETMVVLLVAGNRIAIPDFSEGIGVIFQPVHTMTGIIAQEMGEVVRGSIHYRALFLVGIVLFFLSLLINYLAQRIVRRYRLSVG